METHISGVVIAANTHGLDVNHLSTTHFPTSLAHSQHTVGTLLISERVKEGFTKPLIASMMTQTQTKHSCTGLLVAR